MKRLVSLLLALSLVLALTACGSKADGAADAAAGSPPRDSAPAEESAGALVCLSAQQEIKREKEGG